MEIGEMEEIIDFTQFAFIGNGVMDLGFRDDEVGLVGDLEFGVTEDGAVIFVTVFVVGAVVGVFNCVDLTRDPAFVRVFNEDAFLRMELFLRSDFIVW